MNHFTVYESLSIQQIVHKHTRVRKAVREQGQDHI